MKKRAVTILTATVLLISTLTIFGNVNAAKNPDENTLNEVITGVQTKYNQVKENVISRVDENIINEVITGAQGKYNEVKENVINTIGENTINEIQAQVGETYTNVKGRVTDEVIAIRDNAIAKLDEIEEEYGIDLTEYKDRVTNAIEEYQMEEDYTVTDLAADIQDIYNELIQDVEDNEVKEKIMGNIAVAYANARENVENQIEQIREDAETKIAELKEEYPQIENIEVIAESIYAKIGEYEDDILELVEAFQDDPKGTVEDLMSNIKANITELKDEVQTRLAQIVDYVQNGTPIPFDTLEGEGQEFDKDNTADLSFRFDVYYKLFQKLGKVYVDDELVDEGNYTSRSGSTIVTLNEDYLNTLDNGEHTIKLSLGNDRTLGEANSKFTITGNVSTANVAETTTETNSSLSPKTGDAIVYIIVLAGVTVVALAITTVLKKNKKN